jgi:hypothetical protein
MLDNQWVWLQDKCWIISGFDFRTNVGQSVGLTSGQMLDNQWVWPLIIQHLSWSQTHWLSYICPEVKPTDCPTFVLKSNPLIVQHLSWSQTHWLSNICSEVKPTDYPTFVLKSNPWVWLQDKCWTISGFDFRTNVGQSVGLTSWQMLDNQWVWLQNKCWIISGFDFRTNVGQSVGLTSGQM